MGRFELFVALRHLRSGGGQTLLTLSAVASGVIIVVFVTALVFGLRAYYTRLLTDSIPHVTITAQDLPPRPLSDDIPSSSLSSSRIEQRAPHRKYIDNWAALATTIGRIDNVRFAVPTVSGQGFVSKGGTPRGVTVVGTDPVLQDRVSNVSNDLVAGHYRALQTGEIVIDNQVAEDLRLTIGDHVRLTSSEGNSSTFTVAGIYSPELNITGFAYVTLRAAEALFGLGTSVNTVVIKVHDIYAADATAAHIAPLAPYEVRSWTQQYPGFLSELQVQAGTAYMVSAFSLGAAAFAIAAILVVSVLQKSKQIGILKALGARDAQIRSIFILEGLGIGVLGSVIGVAIGCGIVYALTFPKGSWVAGRPPSQLWPVEFMPNYIIGAALCAIVSTVLAAYLPARHAARLDPVEVLR